jgi:hypothetical protein
VGLEIEFEYDDTQGGVWSQPAEPDPRRRFGRHWNARLSAASPLFVQLGVALAALVLGAAATAGFLAGRTAQQDRATLLLHLAPVNPFVIDPLPVPADLSPDVRRATPWTNVFDQNVALTLINDGPDPVTVVDATLAAPEFRTLALTSRSASPPLLVPGGISVLRGRAHFVCGDYPPFAPGNPAGSPPVATVAQISVRTADGATRHETLRVDRYSDVAELSVCQRMLGPEVVDAPTYAPSARAGMYSVTVSVTNRAPFPLRADLSLSAAQDWTTNTGLILHAPGPVIIPPHGTEPFTISVVVESCDPAKAAALSGFRFDTLTFTDARAGPDNLNARQQNEALFIANRELITAYCDNPRS